MGRPATARVGPNGYPPSSPSQVSTYDECPRMWGWDKLFHWPRKVKPSARLGIDCHGVAEDWLGKGLPPDPKTKEGKIILPGLHYLPEPSKLLQLERYMLFSFEGVDFHGYKDLEYYAEVEGRGMAIVNDHKTTSDFMWAMTEEQLVHDPQGVIYGYHGMMKYGVEEAWLRWIYYQTRGKKKSMLVQARMPFEQAHEGMKLILPVVQEMNCHRKEARAILDAQGVPSVTEIFEDPAKQAAQDKAIEKTREYVLSLPFNSVACSNYGGCDYQDLCGLTALQRLESRMTQESKKKSLSDLMAERNAQKGDTPQDTSPPEPLDHPANDNGEESEEGDEEEVNINPPESPSAAEAAAPETDEERAQREAKKKGGGKKAPKKRAKKATKKKVEEKGGETTEATTSTIAADSPHVANFMTAFQKAAEHGDLQHFPEAWQCYVETFLE